LNRTLSQFGGVEQGAGDHLRRARELRPLIADATARIEQAREIVPEVLAALHAAGLFRLLMPRSVGGGEVEPTTFFAAIEEIAQADASTAWCIAQGSGCSIAAAYVAPEVAREIFPDPDSVLAWGPFGPDAKAVMADGGYRVTGRWQFASGIRHAGWLGGHCVVVKPDGDPLLGQDGSPVERTMLFAKERATISDVWHVVGLRGTGSDAYAVTDLFVPETHTFTREAAADRREAGPLYRFTTFQLFGVGVAGVALGIGRASLDAFTTLAREKVPKASTKMLRDSAVIQSQVALAEAKLRASRSLLTETLDGLWQTAVGGAGFTARQRAMLRLATTYAIHQAKDVVDTVYHAAGATAIFDSNPFERRFRDVHTVTQQVQAHFANFELAGQALLGLDPVSRYV